MKKTKVHALVIGFYWSPLLNLFQIKKKMTSQLRSVLLQVFAYRIQANKERLKWKKTWQDGFILRSERVWCHFLQSLFSPASGKTEKEKDCTKKINGLQHNYEKTNTQTNEGLLRGLNAEVRKCNHWATGGLLELGSKFNASYMHMKCSFYWQVNLPLANVLWKNDRALLSYTVLLSPLLNVFKTKQTDNV